VISKGSSLTALRRRTILSFLNVGKEVGVDRKTLLTAGTVLFALTLLGGGTLSGVSLGEALSRRDPIRRQL
jgi:hypothetical protein